MVSPVSFNDNWLIINNIGTRVSVLEGITNGITESKIYSLIYFLAESINFCTSHIHRIQLSIISLSQVQPKTNYSQKKSN